MTIFLTLIGFLAAILFEQLKKSWMTNQGLNGLIIGVLAFGTPFAFRQVIRLYPEIRWLTPSALRIRGCSTRTSPCQPAPMATMLRDRTGALLVAGRHARIHGLHQFAPR